MRLVPEKLDEPLRWREPRRVFVNSMSDLFHEDVPEDFIAEVFGVMAVASGEFSRGWDAKRRKWKDNARGPHTFQVLTKRARRMCSVLNSGAFREKVAGAAYRWAHDRRDAGYLSDCIGAWDNPTAPGRPGRLWPLPNVWLGVSVEDQKRADERIPLLLQCPAAVRWVSAEPLLGPIDFGAVPLPHLTAVNPVDGRTLRGALPRWQHGPWPVKLSGGLDWVVVGGESGPGARKCNIEWIRTIVDDCRDARVPVFVKQVGRLPMVLPDDKEAIDLLQFQRDRKGGDPEEWPPDLRVREYPEAQPCG